MVSDSEQKLQAALGKIAPFKVRFTRDSFGYFTHKKFSTLWLKPLEPTSGGAEAATSTSDGKFTQPDTIHHPALISLQKTLEETFPECNDVSQISDKGFQPHLSLGQFGKQEVERSARGFQDEWQEEEMEVSEVYMISRKDFHDPFHVRYAVRLGGAA